MFNFLNYQLLGDFRVFHVILCGVGIFCIWAIVSIIKEESKDVY
jgi:hypothetical protein